MVILWLRLDRPKQEILTMVRYNSDCRTAQNAAFYIRDEEWSPRETLLFVVLASAAGWAAALYPIVVR